MSSASVTPSERRRSQQREDARRTILEAAEALLLEDGYEAFSMRRLASRSGYTAPTIYHHFGDKQGLLDAILEEGFAVLLERLDRLPRHDDPVEAIRSILLDQARFGIENPTHSRLLAMARPNAESPPPSAERLRAALEEPLRTLAARGRLHAEDPDQAIQFLWVLVHGLVSLRWNRPDMDWAPGLVEFSVDGALRGLITPERRGNGS